ncbi:VOC family protein [Streptomyces sp. NPDC087440]|uniref:VOC family protein n=1 Tax=Streptomyces sp. NPDC087440 TaxID=3365790 RepID=UPI003827C651
MTAIVYNVAFDCANAYELAEFWSRVLGSPIDAGDGPGDPEVALTLPTGMHLYFAEVPEAAEGKAGKNRVHLCLQPDGLRDDAVERYVGLGARVIGDHRTPDGGGWLVFGDPEGNEFCVLRSAAERAATQGNHPA